MNISLTHLCKYLAFSKRDLELLEQRDTSNVWRQLAIWILIDPKYGVIRFTRPGSEQHDVIKHIAQLYTEDCKDIQTWKTAVDDAAAAAARSAAGNASFAAEYAARSAAYAARSGSWVAAAVVGSWVAAADYVAAWAAVVVAGSWVAAADYVAEAGYAAPFAAVAVNNAAWAAAAVVVAGSWVTASTEAAARANMANKLIELIKAAPMITTND